MRLHAYDARVLERVAAQVVAFGGAECWVDHAAQPTSPIGLRVHQAAATVYVGMLSLHSVVFSTTVVK